MTPAPRVMPRRTVLAVSGTAVLAAAAACSAQTAAPTATTAASSPAASSTAASSAAASSSKASSAAPTSAAASAPAATSAVAAAPAQPPATAAETSAAAPTGTPLAAVADVESAGSLIVDGADGPVLLASANGSVVGHTAVCTHQGCTIAASGSCPCHGSKFNITTGAVVNGPANRSLDEIPVTVSGGQVYAG